MLEIKVVLIYFNVNEILKNVWIFLILLIFFRYSWINLPTFAPNFFVGVYAQAQVKVCRFVFLIIEVVKEGDAEALKGLWSPEEDEKSRNYMLRNGQGYWKDISRNARLQRCGKS